MEAVAILQLAKKRTRWVLAGGLVVVLAVLSSVIVVRVTKTPSSPFTNDILSSVQFPLYYPTKYPPGYTLDPASISSNGQAVLYQLKSSDSNALTIFVSIQARPSGMNFDDFYNKHLTQPTSHVTSNGPVVVGTESRGVFGGLVTDKDWVLVTSADETASSKVLSVLSNLRKATN